MDTAHLIAMTVEGLDYFVNERHGGDVQSAKVEWTKKVGATRQARKRARDALRKRPRVPAGVTSNSRPDKRVRPSVVPTCTSTLT